MKACFATGWLLALLVLSLTACGGTGQTDGTNGPNVLHVVRTDPLPGYHFASLNRVIHDATQVQDLYKAAYALKTVPRGAVFNCPNDIGLEYHLAFLHGTTSVQQMDLDATGCQFLQINTQDARFTTPSFKALLAKVLNLSSLRPPVR